MLVRFFVRFAAYPVALSLLIAGVAIAPGMPMPLPWLVALVAAGLAAVAFLERLLPYDLGWQQRDADLPADIVHAIVNLTVMHATVLAFVWMRSGFGWQGIGWPDGWPYLVQVFAAGVPLDLSVYVMHRLSHRHGLLWRLHSIHHSSNRLYWLNGERRHPLHAAIMAAPGLAVLGLLGTPAVVVGGWFAILAVHLAFQHANLDYRLGPLKRILGGAELHRWHHRKRFEEAQVNFGEFWLIWDRLFGTFHEPGEPLGLVGIEADPVPRSYAAQMTYPFRAGGRTLPRHRS